METGGLGAAPSEEEHGTGSEHSAGLEQAARRGKRAQVPAACQACRKSKIKCDAQRPCSNCVSKDRICQYETNAGETAAQAQKRKHDELSQVQAELAAIFHTLKTAEQWQANQILRQIRNGLSPKQILMNINMGDHRSMPAMSVVRRPALDALMISLMQSTGPIQDIVRIASSTLNPTVRLPNPEDYFLFRHRMVYLERVEEMIHRANQLSLRLPAISPDGILQPSENTTLIGGRNTAPSAYEARENIHWNNAAPHQVPAAPWTTITLDNNAVSHLISVFLTWINPAWRFVEEDLFLEATECLTRSPKGMRSRSLLSYFCSPFLVNSICAIASMQSDHDIAFPGENRERITRGQHFHEEALRLWNLEQEQPMSSRATLANIQALCVLSLDSNYRAKDRFGLTLVPIAVQLNDEVPFEGDRERCRSQGISARSFARGRLATHWAAFCTHIIMCVAFKHRSTTESHFAELPQISDAFDDTRESWTGYPISQENVAYRPTLYMQERCRFALLLHEMHDLMFVHDGIPPPGVVKAVDALSSKMEHWYTSLPIELQYRWPMGVDVLELHASYFASLVMLWKFARSQFELHPELPEAEASSSSAHHQSTGFRSQAMDRSLAMILSLAHKGAQLLRDFRLRFGLKISPAWLLQLQAVAAGALMDDLELNQPASATPGPDSLYDRIKDSHTALNEVLRCLLGSAVEVMISRAIAQGLYHTMRDRGILPSQMAWSMWTHMGPTVWRRQDLALVNSSFPNFAAAPSLLEAERLTEMLARWELLTLGP